VYLYNWEMINLLF